MLAMIQYYFPRTHRVTEDVIVTNKNTGILPAAST